MDVYQIESKSTAELNMEVNKKNSKEESSIRRRKINSFIYSQHVENQLREDVKKRRREKKKNML
jgi:hypothetical protein